MLEEIIAFHQASISPMADYDYPIKLKLITGFSSTY